MAEVLPIIRSEMSKLRMATARDSVFKDECMLSFDNPFSEGGLYVNMITWQGYGKDHFEFDSRRTNCKLYLHESWSQIPLIREKGNQELPTKLAIGVEGGFATEPQFELVKVHTLIVIGSNGTSRIPLPNTNIPEYVLNCVNSIIDHDGMTAKMEINTWEASNEVTISKYAENLIQLNNDVKISNDPSTWRCGASGATENIWLNLSTGYIGSGRRNWDGSGGTDGAFNHYRDTGCCYPLVVKLGTITPQGADVYCYAPDEDKLVKDPLLAQHLSHWGINIMQLEKTEQTIGEMEVHANLTYDWSNIIEKGDSLVPISGAGYVGLRNIGSTCYMNSVLQCLVAIPEVQHRYLQHAQQIIESAPADISNDFLCQLSKIATAVLTDKYVVPLGTDSETAAAAADKSSDTSVAIPIPQEKYAIAPRMFKHLVGKGHAEFATSGQQDAAEYLSYVLEVMSKAERVHLHRITQSAESAATPSIFDFHLETRFQCQHTKQVKYNSEMTRQTLHNTLDLRIPLDMATNTLEVTEHMEKKRKRSEMAVSTAVSSSSSSSSADAAIDAVEVAKPLKTAPEEEADVLLQVPFQSCLDTYFGDELIEYTNPTIGHPSPTIKTTYFKTFPRYLIVKLARYYVTPQWTQEKITAKVNVPEHLNLTALRGHGLLPGEEAMPDSGSSSSAPAAAQEASVVVVADESIVMMLVSMGFSEHGSRKAAIATGNVDADTAMAWVFEHMEDKDFNEPAAQPHGAADAASASGASAGAAVSQDALDMLTAMGYTDQQARAAMQATSNDIERAADWLFSHMDDLDSAVAQMMSSSSATAGATAVTGAGAGHCTDDGEGKYSLLAIISHMGKNTGHGHYVCHIKKNNQWALFNDDKVAVSKFPPLEHGFIYIFRRDDGTGSLE